jgi:WD40 repeat protein
MGTTMLKRLIKVLLVAMCFVGGLNEAMASEEQAAIYPQLGHSSGVNAVAVSPDGHMIASASASEEKVKLWDAVSGREIRTISNCFAPLVFSSDGRSLLATDQQNNIKLWNVSNGQIFKVLGKHTQSIVSLAVSRDGAQIVSGDKFNIAFWDAKSGQLLRSAAGGAYSASFSSDGRTVVSHRGWEKTIYVWDVATASVTKKLTDLKSDSLDVAISPDDRTIVSSDFDGKISLWDIASGKEKKVLREAGPELFSKAVRFSPDGRSIVATNKDKTISVWDSASGRLVKTLTAYADIASGNSEYPNSIVFTTDGHYLISGEGLQVGMVRVFDVSSGKEIKTFAGRTTKVQTMAVSPNGKIVASAGNRQTIQVWDILNGKQLFTLRGHQDEISYLTFSPDGQTLASASKDKTIKLWNMSSGDEIKTLTGHSTAPTFLAFSADGRTLTSNGYYDFRRWDIASGNNTKRAMSRGQESITISPDGKTLTLGGDYGLAFWNVDSETQTRTLALEVKKGTSYSNGEGVPVMVRSIAYSADGKTLASGYNAEAIVRSAEYFASHPGVDWTATDLEAVVVLSDVASGTKLKTLRGHTGVVRSLAFSPDGSKLVTASYDNTAKIWDVATGLEIRSLNEHASSVNAASFAANGNVVTGGEDGTIRVWDVATGKLKFSFVNFKDGEWLAITPEGYYNSSEKGGDWMNVRIGSKVSGVNQLYDVFYRPDIVEAKARGDDIASLITLTIDDALKTPPPEVAFTGVPATSTANTEKICYKALATGGGIGEVRLFQNGKLIKSDGFYRESVAKVDTSIKLASVDGATVSRALKLTKMAQKTETPMVSNSKGNEYAECQVIEAIPGDNEISVAAFNANNTIQSILETTHFVSKRKPEAPHLYVLGIGIDKYTASENNLTYAVKDATDFRGMIKEKAKGLFNAANIHIEGLSDVAATKAGIQKAIAAISSKVKPWDSFILFVASHGYLQDNQYYIVTSDFDGAIDTSKMISSNEIVGMSKNIKSLSQLLIFDTCHAGGVDNIIGGLYDARMSVMAKKMGLHIYASAGGTQTALDGYQGNGLFTHALLDSMKADATDSNHDSEVSVAELGESARRETISISKQLGFPQSPNIINFGKDNALFKVK